MVEVFPFKGVIYNKERIDKLDKVMAPPYDIISEDMQSDLYNKHPLNFVRLTLGKVLPDDNNKNNRYIRSGKLLHKWIYEQVLVQTKKTAIFPYKILFNVDNQQKEMNGFFILLKLDSEYKQIKAHEKTLNKPKEDRFNLLRACKANLEPIQLLYIDEKDKITRIITNSLNEPIFDVIDQDGFNHKLWQIDDENISSFIQDELKDKVLFIADGHHRYQTAIDFAKEMKNMTKNTTENSPFNFRMVVLVNMLDKGLVILPTHRLIKKPGLNVKNILKKLQKYFIIEEKIITEEKPSKISEKIINDIKTKTDHKFALYVENKYFVLTLKNLDMIDKFTSDHSKIFKELDVTILHNFILKNFMNIDQKNIEEYVKYTRDAVEAINSINKGTYDFSIFMNATKIEELKEVALAGEHMPQKSTYFLPKMLSGLVIYKMDI
jgi:uncharacterized protein (DUF1015 family)